MRSRIKFPFHGIVLLTLLCAGLQPAYAASDSKTDTSSVKSDEIGTLKEESSPEFGVSLGLGSQSALGNRGALWQGGFPMYELKVHYWLTSHLAIDLGGYVANNYFDTQAMRLGHVDVSTTHLGIDLKYYADLKSILPAVGFISPYALVGGGIFTKTQNSNTQQIQDTDSSLGYSFGGGLRFEILPRRASFEIEGKLNSVSFSDTDSTQFQSVGLPSLSGMFLTATGALLIYL